MDKETVVLIRDGVLVLGFLVFLTKVAQTIPKIAAR